MGKLNDQERHTSNPSGLSDFARSSDAETKVKVGMPLQDYEGSDRPFLTIVIRTQGRRIHTLCEVFLALHGQTDRDIEVLVVGHRLEPDELMAVEQVIEDQVEEMRVRTRLIRVEDGERARPLNVGFAAARGRYIAILDDDDLPFAHWVETFRALHKRSPGRLLRAACVRQSVQNATVQYRVGLRAEGGMERLFPSSFDIFEHLRTNLTPNMTVAFPRGAFHDLGVHFDENLTTTEDWDYIMRVAFLLGVESSPKITSIYRWWHVGESSRSVHDKVEWDVNFNAILLKMDMAILQLPRGSASRLRYLLNEYDSYQLIKAEMARLGSLAENHAELQAARAESAHLRSMIDSSFLLRCGRKVPPPLRKLLRRIARGTKWLVTGQLLTRLRERRAMQMGSV